MRVDAVRTARSLGLPLAPFEEACVVVHTDGTDLVHLSPVCGAWRGERSGPSTKKLEELGDAVLCARCASVVPVSEAAENYAQAVLRCEAVYRRLHDARGARGMDAVRAAVLALLGAEVHTPGGLASEHGPVDALMGRYGAEAQGVLEEHRGNVEGFCLWAAGSLERCWDTLLESLGGKDLAARLAAGRGREVMTAAHQAMRDGGMSGAEEALRDELGRRHVSGAHERASAMCAVWRERIEASMTASGERVMVLWLKAPGGEVLTGPRVDLLALAVLLGRGRAGEMFKLLVVPGWVCELVERWGEGAVHAADLGRAGERDADVLDDAVRLMRVGHMSPDVALRLARRLGD